MNKNKILIELLVPSIEKTYDLFVPVNKKVGTVKRLIEDALADLSNKNYVPRKDTNFFSYETGNIYDVNQTIIDTDLVNGSKIILI